MLCRFRLRLMEEHLGTGDISLVIKFCKYIEDVDMDDNFQLALWITVAVLMMFNMFLDAYCEYYFSDVPTH